jgi:hypothetical protein
MADDQEGKKREETDHKEVPAAAVVVDKTAELGVRRLEAHLRARESRHTPLGRAPTTGAQNRSSEKCAGPLARGQAISYHANALPLWTPKKRAYKRVMATLHALK